MCSLSVLVIIEYVGGTWIKLPSDSWASTMHQSLLPSFAELFNEFSTPPFIIVGSNFVLENIPANKDVVVVKAIISIDNQIIATGMAEEKRAASRINQTSALENAETSAVGRALAMCGITNDNIASAEEVSTAIEQQDKKIQEAITTLKTVSHAGNYQEWLTKNKTFLADLKDKNPLSYNKFVEKFTDVKSQLKSKGVLI